MANNLLKRNYSVPEKDNISFDAYLFSKKPYKRKHSFIHFKEKNENKNTSESEIKIPNISIILFEG